MTTASAVVNASATSEGTGLPYATAHMDSNGLDNGLQRVPNSLVNPSIPHFFSLDSLVLKDMIDGGQNVFSKLLSIGIILSSDATGHEMGHEMGAAHRPRWECIGQIVCLACLECIAHFLHCAERNKDSCGRGQFQTIHQGGPDWYSYAGRDSIMFHLCDEI